MASLDQVVYRLEDWPYLIFEGCLNDFGFVHSLPIERVDNYLG